MNTRVTIKRRLGNFTRVCITRKNGLLICIILIYCEYMNSMLRYFGMIDMSIGIIIRKVIFVVLMLGVIYNCMVSIRRNNILVPVRLLTFFLMYFYFGVMYLVNSNEIRITDISNIYMPLIVGMLGYMGQWHLKERAFEALMIIYLFSLSFIYLAKVRYGAYRYSTVGLNSIYYIVLIFPMIFIIKNEKIRCIALALVILLAIISLKATVIVMIAFSLIVGYVVKNRSKLWKMVFVAPVVAFIIVIGLSMLAASILDINLFEEYVFENPGGIERLKMWKSIFNGYLKGNLLEKLFGFGYDSVMKLVERSAHNDYIEILYDFGIVGLVLLVVCTMVLIRIGIKMIKYNYKYSVIYIMLLANVFILFILSNSIFVASYLLLPVTALFAMICRFIKVREKEKY